MSSTPKAPDVFAGWQMARHGCHWTRPDMPRAIISTINTPEDRTANYEGVVNFERVALTRTFPEAAALVACAVLAKVSNGA